MNICGIEDGIDSSPNNTECYSLQMSTVSDGTAAVSSIANASVDGLFSRTNSSLKNGSSSAQHQSSIGGSKRKQSVKITVDNDGLQKSNLQEEVDQLMDHLIEINSNTKMREDHVHPLSLEFLDRNMETEVFIYFISIFN